MSKPKPILAVAVDGSVGGNGGGLAASYLSESGYFAKEGFRIGRDGIQEMPGGFVHSDVKLDDLELGKVLGKGACSEVRQAVHRETGKIYALKKFDVADDTRRKQLIQELRALGGSRCPALIALQDVFFVKDTVFMMLEYMDAGTLEGLIASRPAPSEPQAAAVIKQVVAGLFFLHRITKQVHRDLKPANILLNNAGQVKISDFGLTRQMESMAPAESFVGTLMYLSPERMKGEPYGFEADVWSLGLIVYELVHRKHPYRGFGNRFIELIQTILESPVPQPDRELGFSDQYADFLSKCLAKEQKERFSVVQLHEHAWLKGKGGESVVASWVAE